LSEPSGASHSNVSPLSTKNLMRAQLHTGVCPSYREI
jgi:hypothetical protein